MQRRNRRGGVEDRWTRTVKRPDGSTERAPSTRHGKGLRWLARYVDDEGRENTKSFARKADAQRWLDGITAAQVTGGYVDPRLGKVTFASFYRDWAPRQVWVSTTRRAMDLATGSVPFGDVALSDVRPSHVEVWVKAMQDKPLAPITIQTRMMNVRSVFRAAIRDRMVVLDPTADVRLPRLRKAAAAMSVPTTAEVGRLLRVDDARTRVFIALCAFAGLRLGEAAALQVGDVDFLRREIRVTRQVQRAKDAGVEVRAPKFGSERTVYAPAKLLEMLSEHLRTSVLQASQKTSWLFEGDRGNPWHQNTVGWLWLKASSAADVDFRLHDLRHFYASGLIREGCDVVTVQRALGHSNAAVTLRTYSHLWPDANDRTRRAAAKLLDDALAPPAADQLRTESVE